MKATHVRLWLLISPVQMQGSIQSQFSDPPGKDSAWQCHSIPRPLGHGITLIPIVANDMSEPLDRCVNLCVPESSPHTSISSDHCWAAPEGRQSV